MVAGKLREDGHIIQEEYPIGNGKTVDLVARKCSETTAIEIETGKSDAVGQCPQLSRSKFRQDCGSAARALVKRIIVEQTGWFAGRRQA